MGEGMFEFVTAAADEFLAAVQLHLVARTHRITGLMGQLLVDPDLPGEDGAARLFPAFAQPALHERLIETGTHER
jgi:hypothetical protein